MKSVLTVTVYEIRHEAADQFFPYFSQHGGKRQVHLLDFTPEIVNDIADGGKIKEADIFAVKIAKSFFFLIDQLLIFLNFLVLHFKFDLVNPKIVNQAPSGKIGNFDRLVKTL
jgi:hypothetical protein